MTGPLRFEDLSVGDQAKTVVLLTEQLVDQFVDLTGDHNPLHMDDDFAVRSGFRRRVVHGLAYGSFVSRLIGMDLPGAGALWLEQSFQFREPVFIGDELTLTVTVSDVSASTRTARLAVEAVNQLGVVVMAGHGQVLVPAREEVEADDRTGPPSSRLALVTGGSGGIGGAIARRLAANGHPVVVTFRRNESRARRVCDDITADGGVAHAVRFDADGGAEEVDKVLDACSRLGALTSLVLTAGTEPKRHPFLESTWEQVACEIETYVASSFRLCQAFVPAMIEAGGGSIVGIGTTALDGQPPAGLVSYVVAKQALQGLLRTLAIELGPQRIRVNLVSPGMTETEFLSHWPARSLKVAAAQAPLRRLARPDDVAGAVAWLCSDDAEHVTGHNLVVSGGTTMR